MEKHHLDAFSKNPHNASVLLVLYIGINVGVFSVSIVIIVFKSILSVVPMAKTTGFV